MVPSSGRRFARTVVYGAALATAICVGAEAGAATDVLTNNYDDFRTGANLRETILNVSNVKVETFGRLYSYSVDGAVFGQPLVVNGIQIPNRGLRDVVGPCSSKTILGARHSAGWGLSRCGPGHVAAWRLCRRWRREKCDRC